ncbi:MAG: DEAD/DEAH box helicase family protein [Bacteroides sp.]|nr:DEAD/DEAH box helicase family protein [Bacteroides sp.]MCM1389693.1 DEAD/DEAH box helicase family protein [Bacteroides sp.]
MAEEIDKSLSEEDIKHRYITPAIESKGWDKQHVRMEYPFTAGRVIFDGDVHAHKAPKRADYLLYGQTKQPIAIVEAKAATKSVGSGMQQAIDYAVTLDVPFAYSSNGQGFIEHDFLTGKETEIALDKFPTPDELHIRLMNHKELTLAQQDIVDTPFYFDAYSHEPRYYQRIAINRTVEAIAKGQERVLIVMATGTGKTYTAFQIIHRLHKSGAKKKILYLADRNILIDQTMTQDFKPFAKVMCKVKDGKIDSAYEIYMALYHQLVGKDGEPDPFLQVSPDFFDLIVVDECHRGSAKDDSAWRKVLEYFNSATQIGMTATPKAENGANNLDYFGKPIYTYSLLQGIQDGFLAPYRVTNSYIDLDLNGFTPEDEEEDVFKRIIEKRFYEQKDYGRDISFKTRRELVARRITKMLHSIGRMTKTIVFCTDIDEAEAMRQLLVNMNADLMKKDPRYVLRITGDDNYGKRQLDNFINVDEPYPTVVTTSELLATGVDCKTCGLIVIDKEIGSMTEFKQIIGRGTRLREDKGKWHLEILDFRNATKKFKDPDFDGDPLPPTKPKPRTYITDVPSDTPRAGEPRVKYIVDGKPVTITTEIVSVLGEDGKTMRTESVTSFTKKQILNHYSTLDNFINEWTAAERKAAIVDELKELNVLVDAVRKKNPALADADIFDIVCHVAFDQPALTRRERANNVKKRNYFAKYEGKAREVLEALLEKYAEHGILNFESADILDHAPFNQIGKPQKIIRLFGGYEQYAQALADLEKEIYKVA